MSRIHALAQNPKRTLGGLTAVLAAGAVAVGSGADFSATSANPSNTFSTGTLSIGNSSASAVLTGSNMQPGGVQTGTVTITNTGSLDGTFSLNKSLVLDKTGSATGTIRTADKLSDELDLKITDITGGGSTVVHDGSIAGPTDGLTAKTLDYDPGTPGVVDPFPKEGGARTYHFRIELPSTSGNAFQNAWTSVQFDWSAVQV